MNIKLVIKKHDSDMVVEEVSYRYSGKKYQTAPFTTEFVMTEASNARISTNLGDRKPLKPDITIIIDMEKVTKRKK